MDVQTEDRELSKPLTNEEYTSLHLRRFKEIRHLYGNYARFLKGFLKEAPPSLRAAGNRGCACQKHP